jgi:hypothetical protein
MIHIDFSEYVPVNLLTFLEEDFTSRVLDDIAESASVKWKRVVQLSDLNTSKRDYINGIQPIERGENERTITLVGWLPNAIENGLDPFDLRSTLLNENAKISWSQAGRSGGQVGHKYRAIPFRHGTPGTEGQAGMPMGQRYGPLSPKSLAWASKGLLDRSSSLRLGKRVYKAAQALEKGQRLKTREGRRKGFVQVPRLAPWHVTDIYSGMKKTRKQYLRAEQTSGYTTFRTISEAKQIGWIHPGIQARHFSKQVEAHIEQLVGPIIEAALKMALEG